MMLARAVPTILVVRASLRAGKSGQRASWWPVALSVAVLAAGVGLYLAGLGAGAWVALLAVLAVRAAYVLVVRVKPLRAKTVGIIEAAVGLVFVIVAGLA
jgi:hypothetical protein